MVRASMSISMAPGMSACGRMINRRDKDVRPGRMAPSMRANSFKEKNMGLVNFKKKI